MNIHTPLFSLLILGSLSTSTALASNSPSGKVFVPERDTARKRANTHARASIESRANPGLCPRVGGSA